MGIKAVGAYIPKYRLGKETAGWRGRGEKAVANHDEDSVTMAVAAGMDCLKGIERSSVDALILATTTPTYLERQNAAIVAEALDLRRDIATADVTNVLRAGTSAMLMAVEKIKAGSAKSVLVIASDRRLAAPGDGMEGNIGDGAAAILLAADGEGATIEGSYQTAESMIDLWRNDGDEFVRSWEDRFVIEEGFMRIIPAAVKAFLGNYKLEMAAFSKVCYHSTDARRHGEVAKALKLGETQVQDPMYGVVGNTGAAFPLMQLVAALEEAKSGDMIMVVGYGDGADIIGVKVGKAESLRRGQRGVKNHVEAKRLMKSYDEYMRGRRLIATKAAAGGPPVSASALWRDRDMMLRFLGGTCRNCGKVQYPIQRVCFDCMEKDNFEPVRMSDKTGILFTYSVDFLGGGLINSIIQFDGGGRANVIMTDADPAELKCDMPLEMSFRRLHTGNGIHNYYWKSIPARA